MKNIIQYFITISTTIIIIGCQANAETSTTPNNPSYSSQWTCGVNAVCGNVSGIPAGTIGLTAAYLPASGYSVLKNGYAGNIINGNFVIPVLSAKNGSQYNISGVGVLGNNASLCHVTGNPYIMGSNNNNIQVQCGQLGYSIGGTVSGLNPGEQLAVEASIDITGASSAYVTQNGDFTLTQPVEGNATYNIPLADVVSQPSRACTITNESGTLNNANVTNIQIQC